MCITGSHRVIGFINITIVFYNILSYLPAYLCDLTFFCSTEILVWSACLYIFNVLVHFPVQWSTVWLHMWYFHFHHYKFNNVRAIYRCHLFKWKCYGSYKFLKTRWRPTPPTEKNLSKITNPLDGYNCGRSLYIEYSPLLPISLNAWNNCTFLQKCTKRQNS